MAEIDQEPFIVKRESEWNPAKAGPGWEKLGRPEGLRRTILEWLDSLPDDAKVEKVNPGFRASWSRVVQEISIPATEKMDHKFRALLDSIEEED